jgi:hypothetical protein
MYNKNKREDKKEVIDNLKDNQNKDKMNEGINTLNDMYNKNKKENEKEVIDNLKDNQNKDKMNEGVNKLNDIYNKNKREDKKEVIDNLKDNQNKLKNKPRSLINQYNIEKNDTLTGNFDGIAQDTNNKIKPIINDKDLIRPTQKDIKIIQDEKENQNFKIKEEEKKLDECCIDMKLLNGWLFLKINSFIAYEQKCRMIKKYFSKWQKYAGIRDIENNEINNFYQH